MKELSIEVIQENPWNVLSYQLPTDPSRLLLRLACLAADYCRKSEQMLMFAVRDGEHVPKEWRDTPDCPDAHEFSEGASLLADEMYRTFCERLADRKE